MYGVPHPFKHDVARLRYVCAGGRLLRVRRNQSIFSQSVIFLCVSQATPFHNKMLEYPGRRSFCPASNGKRLYAAVVGTTAQLHMRLVEL